MAKNSRQTSRRRLERRSQENRKILHSFGSDEWVEEIKKDYVMWPKNDKRNQDRRQDDRRTNERRIILVVGDNSFETLAEKGRNILSDEEKQMLNELISSK